MVLVPTANSTAMENMTLVKGTARLTALMAYSPTPFATNRPSTMEYRENTIREATVAAEKWTNWESRLRLFSILDDFPFLSAAYRKLYCHYIRNFPASQVPGRLKTGVEFSIMNKREFGEVLS